MQAILKSKKGQLGMELGKTFLIGLMTLLIIGVTTLIVLNALGDTSIVSDDNDTTNVINNGTEGISEFFSNTGIWLSLLAIVVLILIIAVVIGVVNRFGGGRASI